MDKTQDGSAPYVRKTHLLAGVVVGVVVLLVGVAVAVVLLTVVHPTGKDSHSVTVRNPDGSSATARLVVDRAHSCVELDIDGNKEFFDYEKGTVTVVRKDMCAVAAISAGIRMSVRDAARMVRPNVTLSREQIEYYVGEPIPPHAAFLSKETKVLCGGKPTHWLHPYTGGKGVTTRDKRNAWRRFVRFLIAVIRFFLRG